MEKNIINFTKQKLNNNEEEQMAFYNDRDDMNNFVISFSSNPQQDFGVFAKGYRNAAKTLAEDLLQSKFLENNAYPIVFLYRHAFELYLKHFFYWIVLVRFFSNEDTLWPDYMTNHQLTPLAKLFFDACNEFFPNQNELLQKAKEIYDTALEFDQIDRNSFGYRYPIDKKGNYSTSPHQIVNLRSFYEHMEQVMGELEIFAIGLNVESDKRKLSYELIEEVKKYLGIE